MRIVSPASLAEIREQERSTDCNSTIGGYRMDWYCPLDECIYFRVVLDEADGCRLYLLGDFAPCTLGTCRPSDLRSERFTARTAERVASFARGLVDLRVTPCLLPVAVTADAVGGPIVLIDGNHRAIWQHLTHGGLSGVPVYV